MLKIIGGEWKGRRLVQPAGIRPTAEKVRKAAFDILGEAVAGAQVLDLFAGSGALGLEALSRGAAHATFVECEPHCVRTIKENVARMGPEAAAYATVRQGYVTAVLRRASHQDGRFDLVLMDPSYGTSDGKKCLLHLDGYAIISPRGWVMVEHALQDDLPDAVGHLARRSQHRYGDTVLSLYGVTASPTDPVP